MAAAAPRRTLLAAGAVAAVAALAVACRPPGGPDPKASVAADAGPNPIRDLLARYPDLPEVGELVCTDQDAVYQSTGAPRPTTAGVLRGEVGKVPRALHPLTFWRFGETFLSATFIERFGFGPFEVSVSCAAAGGYVQLARGPEIGPQIRDRLRGMGYQPREEAGTSYFALPTGSDLPWRTQWPFAAYDEGTLLVSAGEDELIDALTVPRADETPTPERVARARLVAALGPQLSVSVIGPKLAEQIVADLPPERRPDPRWRAMAIGVKPLPEQGAIMTVALLFASNDQAVRGAAFLPTWSRSRDSVVADRPFSELWSEPEVEVSGDLVLATYRVIEGFDPHDLVFQRDLGFTGLQAVED